MRRLRIPPVFLHRLRQLFQCGDFLPAVAAIIAAKQSYRFDAGVYDFVVSRIDSHRANVAVEQSNPTLAAVSRFDRVRRESRRLKTISGDCLQPWIERDAILKMARDFLPAAIRRAPGNSPCWVPA